MRRTALTVVLGVVLAVALLPSSPASAAPPTATFTVTVSDTNLVTLAWQVTGGDSSNLLYIYEDIGFRPQDCTEGPANGCQTTLRARAAGVQRYTLSVRNNAGEFANITREVVVPTLAKPTVPSPRVHVDMLNKTAQTLSWTVSGPNDPAHHFVEVVKAGTVFPIGVGLDGMPTPAGKFPLTGSYTVPASELPATGEHTYNVAYCRQPDLTQVPICSTRVSVTWVVEPAQFTPGGRRFLPAAQPASLSWQGSGNMWFVSAPSLGVAGQWTTTPSITIPAAQVVPGVHAATVVSCVYGGGCSNRQDVTTPKAGTVHHRLTHGERILFDSNVATITPDDGSAAVALTGGPPGAIYYHQAAEGAHVAAGAVVGYAINDTVGKVQLVVGGGPSVANLQSRTIAQDFTVQNIDTSTRGDLGQGLDINFDSAGGIWSFGEFSTAVGQVQGTTLSQYDSPSARVLNPDTNRYEKTKPFQSMFGIGMTNSTGLAERVIDTGSAVYVTQGGGSNGTNYSRLLRISRTTTDNPATPDDDRVCAIHLPGDNQQVIGVAHDPATNRIWYSELPNSGKPGAVSWFVDGELGCDNDLAYQLRQQQTVNGQLKWVEVPNTAAIDAAAAANRCDPGETSGCIRRIDLPSTIGAPGHVVVDSAGGFLWVVDYYGAYLGRVPLNGATPASVQTFPLPKPVIGGWFNGYPWQIRVDANAVYLIEYADNQLLRFDKTVANPTQTCVLNAAGSNPCFKEIFLPMAGASVRAHSIALRNGKLWFTMTNESRGTDAGVDGAYFGYIDTASWAGSGSPTGRIYNNLSSLGAPPSGDHRSIRGIEVSAAGKVATTDMHGSILVLTPR